MDAKGFDEIAAVRGRAADDTRRCAFGRHALRRCLLARTRRGRSFSGGVSPRHGAGRMARHHHAGRIRRRGPWGYRGGGDDARGREPWRRHGCGIVRAHQSLRAAPDRRERHAGSEAALDPEIGRRRRSMLLRLHRAGCRPRYNPHQDIRREGTWRVSRSRAKGVDVDSASREQDHAAHAHDPLRGLRATDRRYHDFLHRPRPREDRCASHPEDGPQGRRLQCDLHRWLVRAGRRPRSARRVAVSQPSCTASTPSAS